MDDETEIILEKFDIDVICKSPLEIETLDGSSIATGYLAKLVIQRLQDLESPDYHYAWGRMNISNREGEITISGDVYRQWLDNSEYFKALGFLPHTVNQDYFNDKVVMIGHSEHFDELEVNYAWVPTYEVEVIRYEDFDCYYKEVTVDYRVNVKRLYHWYDRRYLGTS